MRRHFMTLSYLIQCKLLSASAAALSLKEGVYGKNDTDNERKLENDTKNPTNEGDELDNNAADNSNDQVADDAGYKTGRI